MKTPKQIKDIIQASDDGWDLLYDLIRNEEDGQILGMEFKWIIDERCDSEFYYYFSLDGVVFGVCTEYNSWDFSLECYDVRESFFPARKEKVIREEYVQVPWE